MPALRSRTSSNVRKPCAYQSAAIFEPFRALVGTPGCDGEMRRTDRVYPPKEVDDVHAVAALRLKTLKAARVDDLHYLTQASREGSNGDGDLPCWRSSRPHCAASTPQRRCGSAWGGA